MALSSDDNSECISLNSYSSSKYDDNDEITSGTTEESINEDDFENKLLQAFELTYMRSSQSRINGLLSISKALCTRYFVDFLSERKVTITDILERCIKKGKGEERGFAAFLASLVCVTLGASEETDSIFSELESHMLSTLNDASVSGSVRAKVSTSLALCCFISAIGAESADLVMNNLYTLFSASFFKGNGIPPNHNSQITALHSCALLSWSLLLTIQSPSHAARLMEKHVTRIVELLDSNDVDLRIAAGETIAVIYEVCRESNIDLPIENEDLLCDKLRQLATDSQKFRAKKDRRLQRSSFRDVLKCVEEEQSPSITVKFGRERLILNSWCRKRQYDAFCHVLGSGMNLHLTVNELLREIFNLGPPISYGLTSRASKFERKMGNLAASKARTKVRGKLRDKRADVLGE